MIPYIDTTYCSIFYSSVPIVFLVVSVFTTSLSLKINYPNKTLTELSKVFLLVFTIHPFLIPLLNHFTREIPYIGVLVSWIGVSGLSIIISWCILKIPYASNFLKI